MPSNRVARAATRKLPPPQRHKSKKSTSGTPSLSYVQFLRDKAERPNKRKGERTRDRLLAAAAELLESKGYRDLRVSDVNEKAGVSNALFYLYFTNKEVISREVLSGFLESLYPTQDERPRADSAEESIYRANLMYTRLFAANPGLMRCLLQLGDEVPEFGRLWREANRVWLNRVVARLSREPEVGKQGVDAVWATVAAVGTMVDGMLRILYIEKESATRLHVRALGEGEASLALFLTRIWVRALYSRDLQWQPLSD
jgi:TetR/AcrR family transcriptional regulator, transcriptional repressor for nem operon